MTVAHLSPPEPGAAPKYPFSEWLDGRRWTLVRGRDFWDTADVFVRRLRGAANAHSIRAEIEASDDGRFVFVEASRAQV